MERRRRNFRMPATLIINGLASPPGDPRSLFDRAEALGIEVPTSCRKQGKCKECMVEITAGMDLLSPPTEAEAHLRGRFRLACQSQVTGLEGAVHCHTLRRGQMRIETQAAGMRLPAGLELDPAVRREGGRILIEGEEVERSQGPLHGLAMDLGTTTVVLRLYDLETGACLASGSLENPQRFGGAEVMSRIAYDTSHPGKLLLRTLAGYLSREIEKFPVDPRTIYELVVVGNPTMRDLFFHENVFSIGQTPYRSFTELEMAAGRRASTSLTQPGRRSLLPIHPRARVYGAPLISGHVGADAAATLLAVDMAREERLVAIMDIGTNTELILGNRHRMLAASCPAGPAFEGGAITCGMPALEGAIEAAALEPDGSFRLRIIGDGKPAGICGSGLVSALSELLRGGRMNSMGRFSDDLERITLFHDASDSGEDVYLLESDVNELAQAKGANVAGLRVVADAYGVDLSRIEVFYLAGGFGRHLDLAAAQRIGLTPNLEVHQFVQAGNLAIEGAAMALLSLSRRRELEAIVKKVEHCRLETHPGFFDYFVEGCQFKPLGGAVR